MFHINLLFVCRHLDQADRPVRVVAYDINKCFKFCLYLFRSQGYFESSGRSRFKFFLAAGQIDTLIITSDAVDRERSLSGIRNLKRTRYLTTDQRNDTFLFGSLPNSSKVPDNSAIGAWALSAADSLLKLSITLAEIWISPDTSFFPALCIMIGKA